jgi:hypothetical protein
VSTCAPTTLAEAIAGAVETALDDTLSVERLTRTPDSSGGSTESYQAVTGLDAVPCRIVPQSVSQAIGEQIVADRLGLVDPYVISVPYGTDIRVPDELVAHGQRFHVQAAPSIHTGGLVTRVVATVVA